MKNRRDCWFSVSWFVSSEVKIICFYLFESLCVVQLKNQLSLGFVFVLHVAEIQVLM